MIEVKLKKLAKEAVVPSYSHHGDVGMDMTAIAVEYDEEKDLYIYHTGLAFASDYNIGQFLFCRSSNCKTDCYLTNGVGIADSAIYRGEIQFRFKLRDSINTIINNEALKAIMKLPLNATFEEVKDTYHNVAENVKERARKLEFAPYNLGDRVGQMVFMRYEDVSIEVADELNETVRGEGGFGSTGE